MTTARLQATLDQLLATSGQRWLLVVISVASIVTASVGIIIASPFADTWVVFVVAPLALVVAAEPDEQLGLTLLAIVIFHWIVLSPSVASPWAMGLAACLHIFHATVALMAVTPHSATIDGEILMRLARRSLVVGACTLGVWILVLLLERREAPGNAVLLTLALAVLAGAVAAFRSLSVIDRGMS